MGIQTTSGGNTPLMGRVLLTSWVNTRAQSDGAAEFWIARGSKVELLQGVPAEVPWRKWPESGGRNLVEPAWEKGGLEPGGLGILDMAVGHDQW